MWLICDLNESAGSIRIPRFLTRGEGVTSMRSVKFGMVGRMDFGRWRSQLLLLLHLLFTRMMVCTDSDSRQEQQVACSGFQECRCTHRYWQPLNCDRGWIEHERDSSGACGGPEHKNRLDYLRSQSRENQVQKAAFWAGQETSAKWGKTGWSLEICSGHAGY